MKRYMLAILFACFFAGLFSGCKGGTTASGKQTTEEEKKNVTASEGRTEKDTQAADEGKGNAVISGAQAENGFPELPEGYVLSAVFENAGTETEVRSPHLIGNILYYYNWSFDRQKEEELARFYIQEKGKEARQLRSFGEEDSNNLLAMTAGQDGSLYLLYGVEDDNGEIRSCTLEKRDAEQNEIYSVDTTAGMEEISGVHDMAVGTDGSLYGLTITGIVLCWDEAGQYQGRFSLPVEGLTAKMLDGTCFGLVNAGGFGIYAYWGGEEPEAGDSVHLYNLNQWREMGEAERGDAAPLRVNFESAAETVASGADAMLYVFSGCEDGLYLADTNQLWRINLTDGSLETLWAWQDFNLKPGYVKAIRRQANGGFLLYIFDTFVQENFWVSLEPVPASQISEKTELVLGVVGSTPANTQSLDGDSLASKMDQVVLSYNQSHPDCPITLRWYGTNSITEFQLELLNGEGPDILLDRDALFDMEMLAGKGAIEDLAPYLAKADGISTQEILPGILELITNEGKISSIPLSFAVDVVIVPKDTPKEVMTPQDLAALITQKAEAYTDYWFSPTGFLCQLLSGAEMDRYVDEANQSCSFDSGEFAALLETIAKLGEQEELWKREERAELFHSGQLPVIVEEMNCMEDYFCIRAAFSDSGKIVGFPNSSGELRYPAKLYDWMGINSASKYKEEAWDFIVFCLSYMSHSDGVTDRFVVTTETFDEQTRYENKEPHFIKWNDYDGNWIGWQDIPSTTQEETDFLREISSHLYLYDNKDLLQIIEEEADMFFKGDIDANEAAKRIQNRASLVLAE